MIALTLFATLLSFSQFKLDNGLTVYVHEDHTVPVVAVNVWYHVGSRDEVPGKSGFAHLFEHMMFQGSAHVADKMHFKYIQEAGGTANASTTTDRTNYFETLPSNFLETGLVARVRSHGLPAVDADQGEARQPARRRAQREAAELRQSPVRHGAQGDHARTSIRRRIRITT